MDPAQYFIKNPDLASLHIAMFFFVVGTLVGWVLWAGQRRLVAQMQIENEHLARQLEADCHQQAHLERKSNLLS